MPRLTNQHVQALDLTGLVPSHLEEGRQLVLHQLPEISSAQCDALAVLIGVAVEHLDE